jgi:hypothetical protein
MSRFSKVVLLGMVALMAMPTEAHAGFAFSLNIAVGRFGRPCGPRPCGPPPCARPFFGPPVGAHAAVGVGVAVFRRPIAYGYGYGYGYAAVGRCGVRGCRRVRCGHFRRGGYARGFVVARGGYYGGRPIPPPTGGVRPIPPPTTRPIPPPTTRPVTPIPPPTRLI